MAQYCTLNSMILGVLLLFIYENNQSVYGKSINRPMEKDLAPTVQSTTGLTAAETATVSTRNLERGRRSNRKRPFLKITEEEFNNAVVKDIEDIERKHKKCLDIDKSFYWDIPTKSCNSCERCRELNFGGSCITRCRTYFNSKTHQEQLDQHKIFLYVIGALSLVAIIGVTILSILLCKECKKTSKMKDKLKKIDKKINDKAATADVQGQNNLGCDTSTTRLATHDAAAT